MLQSHQIADQLDELALLAAALTAAIDGMEVLNEEIRSGVSALAWNIRDGLRKLSDEVHPTVGSNVKAVAS